MITIMLMAAALQPVAMASDFTEAELKHYFRVCDRNASELMLDDADGANCSVVYEELKRRVFNGDSRALLEWWRTDKQK
ncbi:MAG: hypothetical protein RIR70_1645 [Pseudomonadota bacterium]|jgi:hypothetical protein